MERRRSPLGEAGAWLVGLLLPVGGLATALAFTLSGDPAPSPEPVTRTTLVAGASAQATAPVTPVTPAPTATARDSLGQTTIVAAPPPPANRDVAVAGVQVQSTASLPTALAPTPLIGTVGAGPVSPVVPAVALTLTVAGFAWRVHTSAPWPSRNRPPRRPRPLRSSPQTRSAPA